jgi:hypothetical protein
MMMEVDGIILQSQFVSVVYCKKTSVHGKNTLGLGSISGDRRPVTGQSHQVGIDLLKNSFKK